MKIEEIASVIESILFISSELMSVTALRNIITEEDDTLTAPNMRDAISLLEERYSHPESGLSLLQVGNHIQLVSNLKNNSYIEKITIKKKKKTLSQAALEVLSIIAYKQPITKVEIDEIRGVKSDSVVNSLLEINLIEEKGKLDKIGRPILYGTTKKFLIEFGIKDLKELPKKTEEINIYE